MTGRRAIIAGIAGQDGSYLAELLVGKGYRVLGFLKRDEDIGNLSSVAGEVNLEETELVRKEDIVRLTKDSTPTRSITSRGCPSSPIPGTTRTAPSR